jgi:hypothetical protein
MKSIMKLILILILGYLGKCILIKTTVLGGQLYHKHNIKFNKILKTTKLKIKDTINNLINKMETIIDNNNDTLFYKTINEVYLYYD